MHIEIGLQGSIIFMIYTLYQITSRKNVFLSRLARRVSVLVATESPTGEWQLTVIRMHAFLCMSKSVHNSVSHC